MVTSARPDAPPLAADLLVQARTGDAAAFGELVTPLEARLLQQATTLCGNPATAEDLVAETLVEAWKSLARFDESCRLTTWLYAILLHRHHKHLSRLKSRPVSLASLPAAEADRLHAVQAELPAAADSPLETVLAAERNQALRLCLLELEEKHREVVLLRFFEAASVPEIARLTGVPEGTVKSRLHHALNHLRRLKISLNEWHPGRDT
jgi:RNA polymerase sigma-70 factor (ECF subfamily)